MSNQERQELISVIVPCFNEEDTVPAFYREMERVRCADFPTTAFEYIFVDDGSRDGTLKILTELHRADSKVKYLSFSRNFGKEAAILAGLRLSKGDLVTLMDADLQDPPFMLGEMYRAIREEGYDQVGTRRVTRVGEPKMRSLFARMFYRIINAVSEIEMVDGARDYRLMKRCVVDAILSVTENCRYSKGIFSYVGFTTKWLPYENVERVGGTSKWRFRALFRYAVDGIISFSDAPMMLPFALGAVFGVAGLGLLIAAIVAYHAVFLCCGISLLVGAAVLLMLGIMGKYLIQVSAETRKRPLYVLRTTDKDDDEN